MIKSTNTVNIEGTVIDHEELREYLVIDGDDAKTKWLIKPLILVSGAGLAMAALLASVFLVAASLVVVPLMGIAMWAMKSKVKKAHETQAGAPVTATESSDLDNGTPKPA